MAIPQGNFVALQALKPKEYKIGDLYLQMTDYLIKKGEAQKAAQLKAAEERNKYWDEVGKEFKIEAVNSAGRINVLTEKIFKNAWDENDKNKRILQDRSGYYSEADKELARQRLTNIHKNYIAFTTSVSDPNLIKDVNAKLEKVNSGNYFKLDPDLAKNAAVEMGIYDAEMNQDGDIKVYSPTTFGSNDVSAQDWNEFLTAYRTPPADDLVNGKNGVYQLLLDEGSKIKDDWERGDGVTTKSITQFSKQRGETFFNSLIGEKYNPNIHTPKSAWGQLAVTSFGLPELNEKTWDEFKKKTLETMAIQAENASKVNVKLPSGGGNGSGNGNQTTQPSIIQSGSIYRKKGNNLEQIDNAAVLDFGAKGQFAAIKVPNSKKDKNGKRGYHVEYAILGKDQFGRSVYEEITQKTDVTTRLQNLNYDPAALEKSALKNEQYKVKLLNSKKDVGEIKYYGAASDPFQ